MRVVIVSTPVAPLGHPVAGGVSATVDAIAVSLTGRGHAVVVVAPRHSRRPASGRLEVCDGEAAVPAQRSRAGRQPSPPRPVLTAMLAAAAAEPADVALHLAYDLAAVEAAAAATRPTGLLLTMPSLGDDRLDAAVRALARGRPAAVATLTRSQQHSFRLPEREVLGAGLDLLHHPPGQHPARRLVWAARIAAEKRPADALAVAALLGWPIDVCGEVEEPRLWAAALAAHPAARVRHHGHLAHAHLVTVLGGAAVFLQTSSVFEALGLAACEAIACGTPVAAYAGGSAAEVVEPGAGLVVPAGDVAALAAAVPVAAALDRAAVRRSAERRFSLDAFGERLQRWVDALVRGGRLDAG